MLSYILRRLLQVIPVFFGATLLIYFLVFAMPGDPILALFGDRTPNPALVEALREQYHLNDPFIVQYWYYITGVLTGDLGTTFSGRSVADVLADTLPVTGRLAIMAIGIEFTLAIIVGTISGLRKGKAFDNIALVVALVAIAIPIFVLASSLSTSSRFSGDGSNRPSVRTTTGADSGCLPSFSDSASSR